MESDVGGGEAQTREGLRLQGTKEKETPLSL